MTEVILPASGPVIVENRAGLGGGVVGSPPQWSDGSDSTYAHLWSSRHTMFSGLHDNAGAVLEAMTVNPSTVTSFTVTVRTTSDYLDGGGTYPFGVDIAEDNHDGTFSAVFAVPRGSTGTSADNTWSLVAAEPADYTSNVIDEVYVDVNYWGDPGHWAALLDLFASGNAALLVAMRDGPNPSDIDAKFLEAWVTLTLKSIAQEPGAVRQRFSTGRP